MRAKLRRVPYVEVVSARFPGCESTVSAVGDAAVSLANVKALFRLSAYARAPYSAVQFRLRNKKRGKLIDRLAEVGREH